MLISKSKGIFLLAILLCACNEVKYKDTIYQKPPIDPDPPATSLSPGESMKNMYLPAGFRLELVASEPMIEEPVAIAWDGDGKMYVAQMLTYMQNIDAIHEDEPWSRVSVLEDTDGDGKMDKSTVFIDSLILPRIVLPLDDRVIVAETYSRNLWSYRDTDGDRVADEKVLVFEDTARDNRNLEHQPANLTWNIDNWMYLSRDAFRYRYHDGVLERDTLSDPPSGQYGLTQDETGRMFYSSAGGEKIAVGFQQHPVYGALEMEGRWEDGFEEPWPIVGTPDVQGGPKRLKPNGTLNKFTSISGQELFLGDRLPAYGDLFIPEPVGRLVRRAKVNHIDGKIVLTNAYEQTEFLASTDPNFRPVLAATGPDGCLYIVDMYRGIIQEGNWVKEGSFLRPVVQRKGLDKNVGKGRIYRVVHEQIEPAKQIKLLDKSSEDLLEYLGHPNGWYRLTAQKLLVVRQDLSVIPALKNKANEDATLLTSLFSDKDLGLQRLHALWTLDGLGAVDKELLRGKYKDEDPRVRSAAIRLSEKYLKEGDQAVFDAMKLLAEDTNKEVQIQLLLSLRSYKDHEAAQELKDAIAQANPDNEVIAVSAVEIPPEIEALKRKYALESNGRRDEIVRGYQIYEGLCVNCHGKAGQGIESVAPPLAGSPRAMSEDSRIPVMILMDGLSGKVDGKEYGVMAPMKNNDDQWFVDVLNYVRMNLGDAGSINQNEVKEVREQYKDRDQYWTVKELERVAPPVGE